MNQPTMHCGTGYNNPIYVGGDFCKCERCPCCGKIKSPQPRPSIISSPSSSSYNINRG